MGGEQLADDDLAVFVDYLQSIHFGPNPRRNPDDSLSANPTGMSARDGERIFKTRLDIGREGRNTFRCVDCHMRPNGAGTTGFTGLIGQPTKVAQLRGLNERIPLLAMASRGRFWFWCGWFESIAARFPGGFASLPGNHRAGQGSA
jgi:cytochrome c